MRTTNLRDIAAYAAALEAGQRPVDQVERLDPASKLRETAYLALRTSEGIVPARFLRDTGHEVREVFSEELARLTELGLLEEVEGRIRLSGRGVSLADAVARELL